MKTSDPNILRQFLTVLNRQQLTQEVFDILLKKWELDKIDLNEEMEKINQKKSSLSRSKRDAVPEFLKLKALLEEKKNYEQNNMDLNLSDDTTEQNNIMTDTLRV